VLLSAGTQRQEAALPSRRRSAQCANMHGGRQQATQMRGRAIGA
jgi:hypothetical protein